MRYRSNNYLLKIMVFFVVCVLLFCVWHITYDKRNSYLARFSLNVKIDKFYAKVKSPKLQIRQNGEFWILENYVIASRQFGYLESMTYTTHGEYTFLDNLEEVTKRWRAPISVAIFAPSSDFYRAVRSIDHLRTCSKERKLIREMVTFHIYFPAAHMPTFIPKTEEELKIFSANCSQLPVFISETDESYRHNLHILYPINVGRNIARRLARTHFILPCDIEMYPNWNFVEDFMNLIYRKTDLLFSERQVYPLAVFEVEQDQEIPRSKTDLQEMIHLEKAIPFHMKVCMYCHAIPELYRWIGQKESETLDIFMVAKHRIGWEPFYVTTNSEPFFDERYTWEGRYDKQIQADLLSIMNYDFCILDNAFLVHRPGIKSYTNNNSPEINRTKIRTMQEITPQLKVLYG